MNILEEYYGYITSLIQKFGWYVLFGAILLYFSKDKIRAFQAEMSLRSANDPKRRSVLDEQRKKIREKQQKMMEVLSKES